ncbi:hypothetical protein D9756_010159 [Leucocoprinus leucothites]|uniref:Uncharacterized protein n=1 Tax=Leucocoprinus leucothites TaxID=201217 RepID=A0A8H5CVN0_9AGAR|nr:hypothetical protein D9756_010159 [Leucoagaricus leucothites]
MTDGVEGSSAALGDRSGAVVVTCSDRPGVDELLAEGDPASGDIALVGAVEEIDTLENGGCANADLCVGTQVVAADAMEENVEVTRAESVGQDAQEPVVDQIYIVAPDPMVTSVNILASILGHSNPTAIAPLLPLAQLQPRYQRLAPPALSILPPTSPSSSPSPSSPHQSIALLLRRPVPHYPYPATSTPRTREGTEALPLYSTISSHAHPGLPDSGNHSSSSSLAISNDILSAIAQRLDDHTEDARAGTRNSNFG